MGLIINVMFGFAFNPFSAATDFRCQNLTSKVDPCTERIKICIHFKIFIMGRGPIHRYSNELDRSN